MKKKSASKPESETTLVAFLLDRTGSMASVKKETIGGFNGYLDTLLQKPESKHIRFSLTQFDTVSIDRIHDAVPLSKVAKLNDNTYEPRGGTPLYDAIGKTIRAMQDTAKDSKVLFVVLTDGEENSSSEWNQTTIKSLIKEKEDKDKWTFSYIGVGPEAWAANERLAAGTSGYSNVLRATHKNTAQAFSMMASGTLRRCSAAGGQSVNSIYQGKQLDKDDNEQ